MERKTLTTAKVLFIVALLFPMFTYAALGIKGKGIITKEIRTEEGFSGIDLAIDADVFIKLGPEYIIEIKAQENVLEAIETRVKGSNLLISFKESVSKHEGITIYITAPEYDMIKIRGNGVIKGVETLAASDINLIIEGDGVISLTDIKTDNLMANLNGDGRIDIKGTTDHAIFRVDGDGSINTENFNAQSIDISIKGSGIANVKVWNVLDVKISGNGKVMYDGDPILNKQLSGGAIVAKR